MIVPWMVYLGAITLMMGVAAWVLEFSIRQRGWPVRWLWVAAILGPFFITAYAALRGYISEPSPSAPGVLPVPAPPTEALARTIELIRPLTSTPAYLRNPDFDTWGLAVWFLASLVVAAVLVVSYKGILRRWGAWRRAEVDGDSVWISSDLGPAVVGYFPSQIVLPIWILGSPREDRGLVLTHEKEHIIAGDPRLVLASWVILVMLPWNLPLWWICKRLRQAVEIDCDLRLVKRGVDVRRYGHLLMEVTDRGFARRVAVLAMAEKKSLLERRVRHLMSQPTAGWGKRAAGPLAIATLLIVSACYLEQPVAALRDRLILWVAPAGTLHLDDSAGPAISPEELEGALRLAALTSTDGSVLDLRTTQFPGGYEYAVIRRAACDAGIRSVSVDLDGPQGPQAVRLLDTCTDMSPTPPDSSASSAN